MPQLKTADEKRLDEIVQRKIDSAKNRLERGQKQLANPNADRWKGQPPAISERVGGRITIPTAEDTAALARSHPDLLEGYDMLMDREIDPEYRLPVSRQWFGIRAALFTMAAVACRYDVNRIPAFLADRYKQRDLAGLVERSLSTETPSTGGALLNMPVLLAGELIPLLRKAVTLYRLGARQIPMPSGAALIPGIGTGSTGGWVGEKSRGSVTSLRLFRRKMSAKKAYGLTALSLDLIEEASIAVAQIVRDDLVAALAEAIEDGCINGTGTEYSPRGLRHFVGLQDSTLNAEVDVYTLSGWKRLLRQANVSLAEPRMIGTLMPPALEEAFGNLASALGNFYYRDQLDAGMLGRFHAEVTNFIPVRAESYSPTDIYHGDFSQVLVGVTREVTLESSRDVTFTDEDGNTHQGFLDEIEVVKATKKMDMTVRQGEALVRDLTVRTTSA